MCLKRFEEPMIGDQQPKGNKEVRIDQQPKGNKEMRIVCTLLRVWRRTARGRDVDVRGKGMSKLSIRPKSDEGSVTAVTPHPPEPGTMDCPLPVETRTNS